MEYIMKIAISVAAVFVGMFIGILIGAWPFMLLWNWLMPVIFGLAKLTFWQSAGLLLLCGFLFKSTASTN